MINYLKGQPIEVIKNTNNKIILILEVNNMGYEIQIPSRLSQKLTIQDVETVPIFTHLQIRDEQPIIYGFASAAERDLFRQLISVSGIGNQLALSLIDTLGLEDLVQAIVTANIRLLKKCPGVGEKTAQRIALELKTKLEQWRKLKGLKINYSLTPSVEILEDLEMTLLALGYTQEEIETAIEVISQDQNLINNRQVDDWIKKAIAHLSE